MLRSAIAVLSGFFAMAVLVIASTALAMRFIMPKPLAAMTSPTPGVLPATYLATNLVASALAALVGGSTTAAIAGRAHLAHGLGLAAVMTVMSLVSMRQAGTSQPRWYQWILATVMPAVAVGGAVLYGVLTGSP